MSADILPCPFCGTDALIQEHEAHSHAGGIAGFMPDHPGSWTIECASSSCNCGMIHDTREQVVTAWNLRAALAAKTEGATAWDSVPQPWNDLYVAVNHLMIQLGAHGEIESRSTESLGVMSALSGIDGGTVSARAMELHEKAHMTLFQATKLALRECGVPAVQQGREAALMTACRCAGLSHEDYLRVKAYLPAAPHPVMDDKSGEVKP